MSATPDAATAASAERSRRKRRRAGAALGALAAAVALTVTAVLLMPDLVTRPGPPGPPVVLPVPTPTVPAADRAKDTAFLQALPDAVLAFAVADQAEDPELLAAGAVEAYRLGYTDGVREVLLRTGQWPLAQDAQVAMADLLAGVAPGAADGTAPPPGLLREGPVIVGGTEVGWAVVRGEGEEASAVWTNGATLFAVTGPSAVVPALYDAFPM